jgi:putative ABC transport system permease protein
MSVLAAPPLAPDEAPGHTSAGGGIPARRALVRWSWRLLRREWRSQVLVTLLLTLAVATAVCGGTAVYDTPPPETPTLGSAEHRIRFTVGDPATVAADVAALRAALGMVEVIAHSHAKAPGYATPIEYRSQAPDGPYAASLLAVHSGRFPAGAGEAAVTDGIAELLALRVGGTIALDGHPRTIVGIVENPVDLDDDFVLVAPAGAPAPQSLSVLYDGGAGTVGGALGDRRTLAREDRPTGPSDHAVATTLVLGAATILLLLVAFVAAAGFAVLGRRRLRQLGMLAAIGASRRQVRLVMSANGFLVGLVAAGAGTAAGVLLWLPLAPRLEPLVGHRIDRFDLPWLLVVALGCLAVAMSTAAAWWPARSVSRLPVTAALSGRPPVPRPSHRPTLLAVVLLAVGLGCLAAGQKTSPALIMAGTVSTALAILFAAPPAIGLLAAVASPAPVTVRLALRDLARHRARSGAAVAAISLALGIPMATVIIASGVQATPSTGNLGDRHMLVRFADPDGPFPGRVPRNTAAATRDLDAVVVGIGGGLANPLVLPLDVALDPGHRHVDAGAGAAPAGTVDPVNALADQGGDEYGDVAAYVATPAVLRYLGIDPEAVPATADLLTGRTGPLLLPPSGDAKELETPVVQWVDVPAYTSLPTTLVTPAAVARRQWTTTRGAWLLESREPITGAQIATARRAAADAGLTVETRDGQRAIGAVRAGATAGGVLLALGVLAITVGLIRSESAADVRTLTAVGANVPARRTLTAATAGGLALLGVVLGAAGAVLGLLAVYRDDLAAFGRVPPAYPLAFLVGVPLVAYVAGWLLAGREPPAIARRMPD